MMARQRHSKDDRQECLSYLFSRQIAFSSDAPSRRIVPKIMPKEERMMETFFDRCAGLDVHKKTVEVCVRVREGSGQLFTETRHFETMTRDLLALGEWLSGHGVTHVVMESTGVFWKPIYNILESGFEVLLVNARHVKQVPGHKTDVKDCQWLAQLMQFGLLRGSFVPGRELRELRDLTRHRSQLVAEKGRTANRIQKTLEDANIKLASVATDILGASGRAMLEALVGGQEDPAQLADLARKRLRNKLPELKLALEGRVMPHHRFMLRLLLDQLRHTETLITRLEEEIDRQIAPFSAAVELLMEIPGIDETAAHALIAEIGTDMSRFPTAHHLASWAGMCPGNNESAGKRKSGRTNPANRWLKSLLVQIAWAASRTKGTYFQAQYHRLARRRGKKRALIAVGHSILIVVHHMLKNGECYE